MAVGRSVMRQLSVALMAVGGLVLLSVALALVPRSWWGVPATAWPVLVPVAGALAALVAGVLLWQRNSVKHEVSAAPTPPDRQVRTLRSWVIPAGAAVVGTVTWVAVSWLQGSVPVVGDGVQRAQLRVESIRTGLTIGAAVTAAFALLLAFRRQQLAERTQQATEYDAGEKRVTELYVKAADQLGSDKAPVRLAGLYALERLAQDNPAHRQSIVEVICAYLRMPYTPPIDQPALTPTAPPPADGAAPATVPTAAPADSDKPAVDPREERQVRLAAQRILARHLRPTTPDREPHPLYWGTKVVLDLTEAVLIDLDLTACHLHNATFTKTHFNGDARFGGVTFGGDAGFDGATFSGGAWFGEATFSGGAWFGEATFNGGARFREAAFNGDALFSKATFSGRAEFGGVTFSGIAGFDGATFGGGAWFGEATFSGGAWFGSAAFRGIAWFGEAAFRGIAWFGEAAFGGDAWFGGATFGGGAGFGKAVFSGDAEFGEATFSGDAGFGETRFSGSAGFGEATFSGDAGFGRARFDDDAGFGGATFSGDAWFDEVTFGSTAEFDGARFNGDASFDGATLAGTRYAGPESVAE
ncbi:pentapeptide repeat-containing protein [Micromonospora sp. DT233]|uniref:pentapeptide repeat-containing protein n=1 Tax=Micromonospora sp. DT233 TaxID=3393432 RepID=UPI003CF8FEC0